MKGTVRILAIVSVIAVLMTSAVAPVAAYSSTVSTSGTITQDYSSITFNGDSFNSNSIITIGTCTYVSDSPDGYSFAQTPGVSSGYFLKVSAPKNYRMMVTVTGADPNLTKYTGLICEFYNNAVEDKDHPENNVAMTLRDSVTVPLAVNGTERSGTAIGTVEFEPEVWYPLKVLLPSTMSSTESFSLGTVIFTAVLVDSTSNDGTSWSFSDNSITVDVKQAIIKTSTDAVTELNNTNNGNATNNSNDGKTYNFVKSNEGSYPGAVITSNSSGENISSSYSTFDLDFNVPAGEYFCVKVVCTQGFSLLPNIVSIQIGDSATVQMNSWSGGTRYLYNDISNGVATIGSNHTKLPTSSEQWIYSGTSGMTIHLNGFKNVASSTSLSVKVVFKGS